MKLIFGAGFFAAFPAFLPAEPFSTSSFGNKFAGKMQN